MVEVPAFIARACLTAIPFVCVVSLVPCPLHPGLTPHSISSHHTSSPLLQGAGHPAAYPPPAQDPMWQYFSAVAGPDGQVSGSASSAHASLSASGRFDFPLPFLRCFITPFS